MRVSLQKGALAHKKGATLRAQKLHYNKLTMWGQTEYNLNRVGYTNSCCQWLVHCAVCVPALLLRCACDKNAGGERG